MAALRLDPTPRSSLSCAVARTAEEANVRHGPLGTLLAIVALCGLGSCGSGDSPRAPGEQGARAQSAGSMENPLLGRWQIRGFSMLPALCARAFRGSSRRTRRSPPELRAR